MVLVFTTKPILCPLSSPGLSESEGRGVGMDDVVDQETQARMSVL